jgi:hypothetical protein
MYIAQTESSEVLEKEGILGAPSPSQLNNPTATGDSECSKTDTEGVLVVSKAPFHKQIWWILQREFRNVFRNTPALIGRFGVTAFLSIVFGLIFLVRLPPTTASPI